MLAGQHTGYQNVTLQATNYMLAASMLASVVCSFHILSIKYTFLSEIMHLCVISGISSTLSFFTFCWNIRVYMNTHNMHRQSVLALL